MQRSRGLHAPAGGFEEDEDWEREVCTVCWQGERGVLVGRERCAVRSPAARDCSLGWPLSGSQHCQIQPQSQPALPNARSQSQPALPNARSQSIFCQVVFDRPGGMPTEELKCFAAEDERPVAMRAIAVATDWQAQHQQAIVDRCTDAAARRLERDRSIAAGSELTSQGFESGWAVMVALATDKSIDKRSSLLKLPFPPTLLLGIEDDPVRPSSAHTTTLISPQYYPPPQPTLLPSWRCTTCTHLGYCNAVVPQVLLFQNESSGKLSRKYLMMRAVCALSSDWCVQSVGEGVKPVYTSAPSATSRSASRSGQERQRASIRH